MYNIAVILWGAYVRATGSGAGCGSRWLLCNGELVPKMPQPQTAIEFTHRMTSGLALLMVISLLLWCWRRTKKGDWPRYSAIVATVFLLNEAVFGALLVAFDHVAQDRSAGRAVFLCLHFANTLLLLGALALTAHWLSNGSRHFVVRRKPRDLIALGLGLTTTMGIGATGTLAALGDTISPATSLREALLQDFSSHSQYLLRLRLLHPAAAVVGGSFLFWMILKSIGRRGRPSRTTLLLVGTLTMQVVLGVMNVVLIAPLWLQVVHLLIADVLWISLVVASAGLVFEPPTTDLANEHYGSDMCGYR